MSDRTTDTTAAPSATVTTPADTETPPRALGDVETGLKAAPSDFESFVGDEGAQVEA